MHSFEYILIMLGAVLISSLISQLFPKISTPLVQIGIGIALTILPISFEVTLDPELFLVLFIAPLLFEDAKKADKPALWRLKRPILLLALMLVFATTLVVGFSVHLLTPSIPLAAAFALAAALSPTDAVAVASLKETATIKEDQDHLLKGESLLNDASGIVSFQFAVAAVLTGAFSLLDATTSFLFMFIGGVAVGVVLMLLRYVAVRQIRASGIDGSTFHVLFEIITPFLVFLVAEFLHVSGIIAVVAAGITYSFSPKNTTPTSARYNIVSTSVWSVISFSLNGLVFLMLGTQLPYVIQRVWSTSAAADWSLVLLIAFILFIILLLRFLWVLFMHRHVDLASEEGQAEADNDVQLARRSQKAAQRRAAHADPHYWKLHLHDALLLSLTGAKGAITLAVVLTIPLTLSDHSPFPERDLIIFLASGVILLSLILANIFIPLIAPKKDEAIRPEGEIDTILDIYRTVIHRLVDHMEPEQRAATEETIQQYYARIRKLKDENALANQQEVMVRRQIIEWEREHTNELVGEGRVSAITGFLYLDQLSRMLARVEHHNTVGWEIKALATQVKERFKQGRKLKKELANEPKISRKTARFELRELIVENYQYVQDKLDEYAKEPDAPLRVIDLISIEFDRRIARMRNHQGLKERDRTDNGALELEIETRALEYEREAISDALNRGQLSRETAKQLRDNVAMMELDIEEQLE